ncbi:MAG TPA: hypothetical protein VI547_09885, partial [Anaerolineales bacterium]|nr:hypothetical protein [Anaerolineales bacterium]
HLHVTAHSDFPGHVNSAPVRIGYPSRSHSLANSDSERRGFGDLYTYTHHQGGQYTCQHQDEHYDDSHWSGHRYC